MHYATDEICPQPQIGLNRKLSGGEQQPLVSRESWLLDEVFKRWWSYAREVEPPRVSTQKGGHPQTTILVPTSPEQRKLFQVGEGPTDLHPGLSFATFQLVQPALPPPASTAPGLEELRIQLKTQRLPPR